jgi:hypothetical protein
VSGNALKVQVLKVGLRRTPTLFLSAPKIRTKQGAGFYRTFDTILLSGVGPDYGIYANLIGQVRSGMRVVVFDRDVQRCAEGVVVNYIPTKKAGNGVQRYNINIHKLREIPYTSPPKVNYFGVAIS